MQTIAMEYSPGISNPYVSRVDGGTLEFVRGLGCDVVSSGDLIQLFEATLSDEQWQSHLQAAVHTNEAFALACKLIAEKVQATGAIEEAAVQAAIMDHFAANKMTTYHPPIVGVNANSGDPHYETGTGAITKIQANDFVLIDLWAKLDHANGIYSDLTRVGYVGENVPAEFTNVFDIVAAARDAGIDAVRQALANDKTIQGWKLMRQHVT